MNYTKDIHTNALLEMYFEEDEDIKIYKESMNELIEDFSDIEYLSEEKLTKEEKEKRDKEKLDERIKKAKSKMVNRIENIILQNSYYSNLKNLEMETHECTPKERALFIGYMALNCTSIWTAEITSFIGADIVANSISNYKAAVKVLSKKEALKVAGKGTALMTKQGVVKAAKPVAAMAITSLCAALMVELIKQKRYKDIYTIKIYGTNKKTGKRKLLYWYTTVKVTVSDLGKYKNRIKQI